MSLANLTPPAQADLAEILERSLTFGPSVARCMAERPLARFKRIENGEAIGHRRGFIPLPSHVRCVNEAPPVISHDTQTRLVPRIVDGRRDLASLLRFG